MADGSSSKGGTIPVWGDGTAIRAYTYVDDLVEGVYKLMQADPARHPELVEGPGGMLAIIGGDEYVTVDELVETVIEVSGKEIQIEHVEALSCTAASTGAPSASTPATLTNPRSNPWAGRQRQACEKGSGELTPGLRDRLKQCRRQSKSRGQERVKWVRSALCKEWLMIAVKALYERGKIEFLEPPPDITQALVAVVFLEMETVEDVLAPYAESMEKMVWGESMDEEGARALLTVHEELSPYRAEVNQVYLDQKAED